MNEEKFQKISDNHSKALKNMLGTLMEILHQEFGIIMMGCGQFAFFSPDDNHRVRMTTVGMGTPNDLKRIAENLKEEIEKKVNEIEQGDLKDTEVLKIATNRTAFINRKENLN